MNNWSFTGNLGRAAETKSAGSTTVTEFSVAVKSGFGDRAATTWAKCQIWGDRGAKVDQYLVKGQLVGITGELTLREYEKKEGGKGYSLEVKVNDLTLLGKGDSTQSPVTAHSAAKANAFVVDEDNTPF